ncbi:MAG: TonB-dependent receptor [Ginsengibacter sp.]
MENSKLPRLGFVLLVGLLISTAGTAQNKIQGTVTDQKGTALMGATVKVIGTGLGTATDAMGDFTLEVSDNAKLEVSHIDFKTQEITVGSKKNFTIQMEASATELNPVVIVGYGTQRSKDVSSAIAVISSQDFNQGIVTNPIEQIQGKVAGLVITNPGGDPNSNPTIRLRGQASLTGGQSPLVVLDGVALDDPGQIANIPPGDIASYNVLKDASATAIYGSRGANGVIIINTKKGRAGKAQVTYSDYIGVAKIGKTYDMLNAAEWKTAASQFGASEATITSLDKGGNTDWTRGAITRTAVSNNHNLSISGGTDKFTYSGSVNYSNHPGIVINTGKNEVGLRFNADQKALNDKLDVQVGILNTQTNRKLVDQSIFTFGFSTPPVYPIFNPDGSYFAFQDNSQANAVMHQMEQLNGAKEHLTIMHATINYELVPGLKLGATGSLSYFNNQTDYFQPSYPVENNFNNGSKYNENRDSRKGDLHIDYSRSWGKNNLSATVVHEYNDFVYDNFQASGQQYPVEQNQNNALENGNTLFNAINSYKEEFELASFLGRITYNFNSKYYLDASFRRDGSSKFGVNNRWGNFPAVSAAWRISGENFMSNVNWINDLKVKAGYGVTGNQDAIDAYRSQQLLGSVGRFYDAGSSSYPLAYAPTQNANPDLKWEEVHGVNIGLDFSLFNNRLSGNVNWFHNKTKNLLYNYAVPVPPFAVNTILANVGDLLNKGVEVQLNADIIKKQHFGWTLNGQITFIRTEITSLSGTYAGFKVSTDNIAGGEAQGRGLTDYPITFLKVGFSPFTFFLPHYLGVDDNGSQLFADGKGGKVTQGSLNTSMYNYINPAPKFSYGITNAFNYHNWGLSFFLRGVVGQKIFNNTLMVVSNVTRLPGNNISKVGLTNGIKDAPVASDLWLEKASYLRLDNFSLSYSFKNISFFQSLQVYVAGNNLFVITHYKGFDPEIRVTNSNEAYIDAINGSDVNVITGTGSDGYYPKSRSLSFGVNVTF